MSRRPKRGVLIALLAGAAVLAAVAGALWQRAHPHRLEVVTDIAASPAEVWAVLVDFPAYAEWNPSLVGMTGVPEVGQMLSFRTDAAEDSLLIEPEVLEVRPGELLRWEGHLLVPGIFDGEHSFLIEPTESGSRLTQREEFRGVLIPFMASWLDTTTLPQFQAMNEALRERVEGAAQSRAT